MSRRAFLAAGGVLGLGAIGVAAEALIRRGPDVPPGRGAASAGTSGQAASGSSPTPPNASPRRGDPVEGTLVIHGAGDSSLDPTYISTYAAHGYGYAWSGLNGLFLKDDLTVVNVECAVSKLGSAWPGKEFNFRGDPAGLLAMREAGVEVANMANNHSYDYGPEALLDMRKNIIRAGLAPVGAGKDPVEANRPAYFDLKGRRVAVIGLDQVVDPFPTAVAAPGHPGTADGHDFGAMLDSVRAAKSKADLLVVMIHWGVELDLEPRSYQVVDGHRLIEAGADVIFGGHSHRLQPLEMYRGRPIFYSLGNFVWPNLSTAGSTTAVAEVRVNPKGRFSARLIPAFIEAPGHPVLQGS